MFAAFALVTTAGCGVNDSPKTQTNGRAPSSAVARCAGQECKVRITCKGRVQMRFGAAPVDVRTSRSALVTTIFIDFAGSRDDATVRC